MTEIRFPKPLQPGDLIAVTAPSSGVAPEHHARLDLVLGHLRAQGYRVVEGECLRGQQGSASAPRAQRAAELAHLLTDPEVAAVMPPWGGELAIGLLELLDFEALRAAQPKWFCGYSDLSTLHLPLTLVAGWATVHGPNLMDLAPSQTDTLTAGMMGVLAAEPGEPVVQQSSSRHMTAWIDFAEHPEAPFNVTDQTLWKRLDGSTARLACRGRLIGGCLDTIARLAGTRYGDVPGFARDCADDGALLYLENAEMSPCECERALWSLRLHGWFDGISGLLVGRSFAPDAAEPGDLSYVEALHAVLDGLRIPVLYDVDIGHQSPQMTLVNGARAEVVFDDGCGSLRQWLGNLDR